MKTLYKVFLVIFILFIGINLYAIQWYMGAFDEENNKFWFSIAAALLGILVVFILDYWSRIGIKKA
ncbi:hypothetical protein GNY06_08340 [Elizabethkingia argentiflava]|uniref:Uncharacterized protein n=1 Tax=Elizabethkingia argenteiflava TaxID=2681556 RepID=A0A845PT17_9FLAO|nr:hypothetical protein [Elizabethkingia argenteiflava]NAW51389.1 hypothetical protein [Elizabethkingia argenteiflava]